MPEPPTLPSWLRDSPDGAVLRLRVQPGTRRPGIAGVRDDALLVRLRARPVEGAANDELLATMATALGVPRSALLVRRGHRGRDKQLLVRGQTAHGVLQRLATASLP